MDYERQLQAVLKLKQASPSRGGITRVVNRHNNTLKHWSISYKGCMSSRQSTNKT